MRYTCSRCGGTYCVSHRLPESHECAGLAVEKAQRDAARAEGEERAWFEEGSGGGLNKPTNRNGRPDYLLNKILVVFIILFAALGFGYFTLSFFGGVLWDPMLLVQS